MSSGDDRTGVVTAKRLAEKANPQADVVMGVAASSLALLNSEGLRIPYAPLNLDAVMSKYRDRKSPPAWFCMDVWGANFSFNTVEAAKRNLPMPETQPETQPETWDDVTKPIYKGQIVMPSPASSGTDFLDVSAWPTVWGVDNGNAAARSTWANCTSTSPSSRTRSRSPATWPRRRARDGHFIRVPRQRQQGQGRAHRPGVPE